MSDPVGVGGGPVPPGHERATLVAELGQYLGTWERRLAEPGALAPARELTAWSVDLETRARQLGLGGVAHHLARCNAALRHPGELDVTSLRAALKDLAELAWQSKHELPPAEQALVDRALAHPAAAPQGGPGGPPSSLEPPRMVTVFPGLRPGSAGLGPPGAAGSPHFTGQGSSARSPSGAPEPPRIISPVPPAPQGIRAPPVGPNSAYDIPRTPVLPAPGRGSFDQQPPPPISIAGGTRAAPGGPQILAPAPQAPADPRAQQGAPISDRPRPNLAVRTMFKLRAFGSGGKTSSDGANEPPPVKPAAGASGSSPILGLRGFSTPPPAQGGYSPSPPQQGGFSPPGAGRGFAPSPPAGSPRGAALPPLLSNSLPPLPSGGAAGSRDPTPRNPSTGERAGRSKRDASGNRFDSKGAGVKAARRNRSAPGAGFPWWVGVLAAAFAGGITLIVVLSWSHFRGQSDKTRAASSVNAAASASAAPLAQGSSSPATPHVRQADPALDQVLQMTHGKGSKESPELKAWVDHQAALQARLLETGKCEGSAAACLALFREREEATTPMKTRVPTRRPPPANSTLRSRWLAGLRMPSIPVADDQRVQRIFERLTETTVGREQTQQILFRCGAYRDLIQATLIRYELPPSLLAVVYAESACIPTIKSPVGAEGLWQFMPEAGRAYHLHITEDVLDERHSPQKSTEAAVHFLADLYAKFGSWDLAFAAYNMGPYGVVGRQNRAGGGDVGFWDLLDADLLPEETANYVPTIQAYALILENLQRLKFAGAQMRAPEVTGELDAPPGTRLGLIARAAATSVNQIRALNLDLKASVIPTIPGQRFAIQVPKDVVWQAREALEDLQSQGSYEDQCVADNFDWGKQRFTPEMKEECRRRLGSAAGKPAAQ